jgi:uncharacterized protein YijF (DUF1287 family)
LRTGAEVSVESGRRQVVSRGLGHVALLAIVVGAGLLRCAVATGGPAKAWKVDRQALVLAARDQVGKTVGYDPEYRRIGYPGGDVELRTGVCTDVLIRALRRQGIDPQVEVHRDMSRHFGVYPKRWGLRRPDRNIDHRRVPNLMTFFKRGGMSVPVVREAKGYLPGDVVTWDLGRSGTHVGLVSDRRSSYGVPLIIHNIGRGAEESDMLFGAPIIGHYRFPAAAPAARKAPPRSSAPRRRGWFGF